MARAKLNVFECLLVTSFISLIFSLVIISKISAYKAQNILETFKPKELILVEVQGEVLKPQIYKVEKGSKIAELLPQIKLKKFADISAIDLNFSILSPLTIIIPPLSEIFLTVAIEGDGEFKISLPSGSRISEVKSKISLPVEVDVTPLKSRRIALPNERIELKKRKT